MIHLKLPNLKYLFRTFLILFLFSNASFLTAQVLGFEEAKIVFGDQKILKFRKFSLELLDESKEELRLLAKLINTTPGVIKNNLLVIQIFSCEKEIKVKPYLGVCRAQVIVDYLDKQIGMPRKKCLLIDGGANAYDKDCLAGSGVNIYIKPAWKD
ncbi:MAG: hypothetical protein AAF696_20865 [Bacteroidota bacterium]